MIGSNGYRPSACGAFGLVQPRSQDRPALQRSEKRDQIRLLLRGEIESERRLVVGDDGVEIGGDAVVEGWVRRGR